MIEQEKIASEKPSEILEVERIFNVELERKDVSSNVNIDTIMGFDSYGIDSNNVIVGLSFLDKNINDVSHFARFENLEYLNFTGNNIENISELRGLRKLKYLYLRGNKVSDLSPISGLRNLKVLAILENPISEIEPLGRLLNLERLYCQRIGIENFFALKNLVKLSEFVASQNNISDIAFLKFLNNTNVDLEENLIRSISKEIAEKFEWLDASISKNFFPKEKNILQISGNPLEFPPVSVIELGSETTRNYYEASEEYGHASLSEGRIIFVGDGSSGKSSLIEKILYNSFTLGREQTNGIKIENLYLEHPEDNRKLSFHIWDFGGQEIQHAVHKFFFTEGCLYIVVLDSRKEEEPEYWLQQIESLGGKAPVLVVFNKQDENAVETTDRKYLKEKYKNIAGFFNTSCKTGYGIEDFKNSLQKEVVKLRTVSEQFPNNWLAVKKAIEENTSGAQHYLTYESYKEICKRNHVADDKAQSLLLSYFNTIGTVTWFGKDTHLKFLHVLNPAWITQGVYKILTAKKTANLFGQINVNDFKELLQPVNKGDYTYKETHYGFILSMMKKFDLCYTPDDKQLLIPSAFGKVPKLEYSDFRGKDVRTYILQFKDYMPLALIHRFTAQKMPEALDNNYWYTGIVLKDSKTQTLAMVHADKEAKRIYVRIKGESKLGVWEHIRRDLAAIASSYAKIPYDELVALDPRDNGTVNYEDLISHLKAEKSIYFHPKLQRDFNVGYLMSLFEPKQNTTDKIMNGQIVISDETDRIELNEVPQFVVNILNNNNPVVNAQVNTQINIDIQIVNEIGSNVKGDADYLLELIGDSNKSLSEALVKVIQFADDVKLARNTGNIKEKGWGRKLKSVLETLGSAGEQLKNMQDGGEVLKSILGGIKELAHHFNLDAISSWFS